MQLNVLSYCNRADDLFCWTKDVFLPLVFVCSVSSLFTLSDTDVITDDAINCLHGNQHPGSGQCLEAE